MNTYIVTAKSTGHSVLIDPASGEYELLTLLHSVSKAVDFVLLTHGHFDHMASAAAVCAEYDAPCLVHRNDYRLVRQSPFYSVRFDGSKVTPPSNLVTLDSPDSPVGGKWDGIETIFSPGHTPGGCCFMIDRFVFTGDTIINGAVGRTDGPGADINALMCSVEKVLCQSPEDGIILPGHGRPWTVREAREWWASSSAGQPKIDGFIQV